MGLEPSTGFATRGGAASRIRRRIFSLPTLLLFMVLAAFMYFLATRFNMDWGATLSNIRSTNPQLYILAILLYYASFLLRGQRWRMLAQNSSELDTLPNGRLPTAPAAGMYILIGWFVNSISWLRLGDGYRAYLFARSSGGGFSWSLGTVLAERVLDVAAVLLILVLSAIALSSSTSDISSAALGVVRIALVVVLAALCLPLLMKALGGRMARFLPKRIEMEYQRFQNGTLGSMKQRKLPILIVLGVAGWLLEIGRLYFVIEALGLDVPFPLIAITALVAAILSTVPIPGGLGVVEPGIVGLMLLTMERHDALSVALVDRSITFLSVIAVGGIMFLLNQLWLARRSCDDPPPTVAEGSGHQR